MRHTNIRLFIQAPLYEEASVSLPKDQAHYLLSVMRCHEGDTLAAFNGTDGQWQAELTHLSKKEAVARVLTCTHPQREEPDAMLCFAPVKNAPFNTIVQKATELGVKTMQPVMTQRTNTNRVNTDRMEKIVIEAAEQCGRLTIPSICEPVTLPTLIEDWDNKRHLILCDESGQGIPAPETLSNLSPAPFAVLIGPEGGFTDSEFAMLRQKSYVTAISMGPRILRADTAAIAALTCCQSILGDWHERPSFINKNSQ